MVAMTEIRQFATGPSPPRLGFNPRPVHATLAVHKMALGEVFL
jgi:hypothetical protein